MRVVFLGTFGLHPKGTMRARALPMAQALAALGHQVTLVLPPWDYPPHSGLRLKAGDVPIINVPIYPRIPLLWYLLVTLRLLKETLAQGPDVVHAFKPKGFSGLALMILWAMKKLGLLQARLVVDTDDWEGYGGWNEMGDYPWWQRLFFAFQERWLLKNTEAVTAASRTLKELATALRRSGGKVYYVPNGVPDPGAMASREKGTKASAQKVRERYGLGKGPTILLYTRFFEFNLEHLAQVFKKVASLGFAPNLLVVGEGFWGEDKALARLIREKSLAIPVVQAGWVEPEDLKDYFAAADLALYPMDDTLLNRAKCPVKLVELLSAGVPVVAEAVGQVKEYIIPEETGLLVEPGDARAFTGAIIRLLRDKSLRKSLGKRARANMSSRFSWSHLISAVEEAYQR